MNRMAAELKRSLGFNDLMAFGVASIMGSGGFNLIGDGIVSGGAQFPLALGSVAALFQGSSLTYHEAYNEFKTNTSESDLIRRELGDLTASVSSICILLFNIISVSTILVISSKILFPSGSWSGQVSFALILLSIITSLSLKGIDANKDFVKTSGMMVIGLLMFATMIGVVEATQKFPTELPKNIKVIPDLKKSVLYFFFVLAGFDALIKFSEEASQPDKDIPRSFYASNALGLLLTIGICFSFLVVSFTKGFTEKENIIAHIVESVLGPQAGIVTSLISVFLMIVTGFICFLTTTRYMFGLGKEIPVLEALTELNSEKVPWKAVALTTIIASIGILINHVYTLVKFSDIVIIVALMMVGAAATKMQLGKGKYPIVEGATTAALAILLSICCI
jgi:basic amino acid/polyamine antiporter, APA family